MISRCLGCKHCLIKIVNMIRYDTHICAKVCSIAESVRSTFLHIRDGAAPGK